MKNKKDWERLAKLRRLYSIIEKRLMEAVETKKFPANYDLLVNRLDVIGLEIIELKYK